MGNDTTSRPSHGLQHFRYQFTIRQRSETRGLLWLIDQKTGREFVLRELTTNDEVQKRRIEDLVVEKRTNRCKYVLRLEDYHLERDKRYCLDQFKAYLLFESPHKDLNEEMLQRRVDRSNFQDEELMSILESGIMGLKYFREVGHPHEAICSSNILINRQGIIMLSDPWYNCDEQRLPIGVRIHPSPERMQANNGVRTTRVDWYAADLYSLAMVVLEAANMDELQDVYTRNNRQIDHNILRKKIDRIRDPQLKMYIEGLLQSQKTRIDTANQFEAMVLNRARQVDIKQVVTTPTVTYEVSRMNTPLVEQNAKASNAYVGYTTEEHLVHKVLPEELTVGKTIPFTNFTEVRNTQVTPRTQITQMSQITQQQVATPNLHSVSPAKSPVLINLQNLTPTNKQQRPHSQVKFNFASPSTNTATGATKVRSNSCAPLTFDSGLSGKIPVSIPPLPPTPKQGMQSTMSRLNINGVAASINKGISSLNLTSHLSSLPSPISTIPTTSPMVAPPLPPIQATTQLPVVQVSSLSRLNSQTQQTKPNFTYGQPSSTISTQSSTAGYLPPQPNWWQSQTPSFIKKVDSNITVNTTVPTSSNPTPTTTNTVPISISPSTTFNSYNTFDSKATFGRTDSATESAKNAINSLISDDKTKFGGYQTKTSTTTTTFPNINLAGLKQGLSQNDADLFTKPELLRDFRKDGKTGAVGTTTTTTTTINSGGLAGFGSSTAVSGTSGGLTGLSAYGASPTVASTNPIGGLSGPTSLGGTTPPTNTGFTIGTTNLSSTPGTTSGGLSGLSGIGGLSSLSGLSSLGIGPTSLSSYNQTTTTTTYGASTGLSTGSPSFSPNPVTPTLPSTSALSSLTTSPINTLSSNTMTTLSPLTTTLPSSSTSGVPSSSTNFSISSSSPLTLSPSTSTTPTSGTYGRTDQPDSKSYRYNILQNNLKYNNVQQSINNLREVVLGSEPEFKTSDSPSNNFNPVEHFTHLFKGSDMVKTSLDQMPEQEVKKEEPKKGNATPSKKKAGNRNNSTIQEVPQSQVSVEEELEYVTEQYEVGSRYEGYKKNGMRNGKGRFYYQDGGYYDGNWKDNKMHGLGKLYYNQNKLAYDGEWYLDEFHGHGKVYNDSPSQIDGPFDYSDFDKLDDGWQYYEGSLVTDIRQGFGRLKLSNGEVYEGEFKYDRIDGRGRFITIKGDIIEGVWRDNKLTKPQ